MTDGAASKSWWSTLPGILTALAGLVTAVGGVLAILAQQGYLQRESGAPARPNTMAAERRASGSAVVADAPVGSPNVPAPSNVTTSPAEIVGNLRAQGFKGIAVTSKDHSVIALRPDAEMAGSAFPLNNGQQVQFDRLASVDIEQPWDGSVRLTFINGQQLQTSTGNYSLAGKNELGQYRDFLSNMRRIEFVR